MRLILASGSPRRRDLLASVGLDFEIIPSDIHEHRLPDEAPAIYVERVAREKASSVEVPDAVVLGADTTVVHAGRMLGKPSHPAEATAMLERLSGDSHTVLTGVAVSYMEDESRVLISEVSSSIVRFLPMTKDEIDSYVGTGEPLDKAGAYALQGIGAIFVRSVTGSPSNVIGLPLDVTARLLRIAGISIL